MSFLPVTMRRHTPSTARHLGVGRITAALFVFVLTLLLTGLTLPGAAANAAEPADSQPNATTSEPDGAPVEETESDEPQSGNDAQGEPEEPGASENTDQQHQPQLTEEADADEITEPGDENEDGEHDSAEGTEDDVPADESAIVEGATLEWGVKASFRNYLLGPIAHGSVKLLGNTTADPDMKQAASTFTWSGGTGEANTAGKEASVNFGAGNGIHFTGHEMTVGGVTAPALDLKFTNPRVEISSPTQGTLLLDVKSREFEGMTEISDKFYAGTAVPVARLTLDAPDTSTENTLTWDGIDAALTEEGEQAFGGFYEAGETLDQLRLTLPIDKEAVKRKSTATNLEVNTTTLSQGESIALTALTSPADVDGKVSFTRGGKPASDPVAVKNGTATATISNLPVGIHRFQALFEPADDTWAHSSSNTIEVTVQSPPKKPETQKPANTASSKGRTPGSLTWPVSHKFVAYTTCDGAERFGMSHCANKGRNKGWISTQGVGSGYLFPQSSDSSWNKNTGTGKVQYSGTVRFHGYGTTMFEVRNPSITVHSKNRATLSTGNNSAYGAATYELDLSRASMKQHGDGAVTWSGVPVNGQLVGGAGGGSASYGIGLDPLTFTIGSANTQTFATTSAGGDAPTRDAAEEAPSLEGLEVLTPDNKIRAGGRIALQGTGFEADEKGILVVLYEGADGTGEPITLDIEARANEEGTAEWTGTLPDDSEGEHIITMQADTNLGAPITILPAKTKEKNVSSEDATPTDAGIGVSGSAPDQSQGMGDWQWWASAGGLVAIAGCTSLLALRHRGALKGLRSLGAGAGALLLAGCVLLTPWGAASEAQATPITSPGAGALMEDTEALCQIDAATLEWGVKESFRSYIGGSIANGSWETADGAEYELPNFVWSEATGTYDPATGQGEVNFTGSVHFTGHDGVLDVTFANPTIEFEGDGSAALLIDATSTDMEGEVAVDATQEWMGDVAVSEPEPTDNGLVFTELPTTLTNSGADAFAGFYEAGEDLDPLTVKLNMGDCAAGAETTAEPKEPVEQSTEEASPQEEGANVPWLPIGIGGAALAVIGFTVGYLVGARSKATPPTSPGGEA